jgi:aminoglycoside 2'-N-acetyltransferase I
MSISFELYPANHLGSTLKQELIALCSQAYEEDFQSYWDVLIKPVHVICKRDNQLVAHAAWVTRYLETPTTGILETAYIEAVATLPAFKGQGYGKAVMQEIVKYLGDYDIAALSPAVTDFYQQLGWELWQGPLAIRTAKGLLDTPDEQLMIYRLPRTPQLNMTELLTVEWREGELW